MEIEKDLTGSRLICVYELMSGYLPSTKVLDVKCKRMRKMIVRRLRLRLRRRRRRRRRRKRRRVR